MSPGMDSQYHYHQYSSSPCGLLNTPLEMPYVDSGPVRGHSDSVHVNWSAVSFPSIFLTWHHYWLCLEDIMRRKHPWTKYHRPATNGNVRKINLALLRSIE
jgi:hypothetical protein